MLSERTASSKVRSETVDSILSAVVYARVLTLGAGVDDSLACFVSPARYGAAEAALRAAGFGAEGEQYTLSSYVRAIDAFLANPASRLAAV